MKKFGLIGDPIKHSMSPFLFGAGYAAQGDKYRYDLIEGDDFGQSYLRFLEEYDGINVTAPFKEPAFLRADIVDPMCRKIGATNLLVKTDEGIKAYNSDYYGIIISVLEALCKDMTLPSPRPGQSQCREMLGGRAKTALVVGCGGAGKAAAVAAGTLGLDTTLINRTCSRAEEIASDLPEYGFSVRPIEDFAECFREADVVVYTLPAPIPALEAFSCGGAGVTSAASDAGENCKILLEANYRQPSFTPELLARLEKSCPGIVYVPGIKWLLWQAYSGYDLFTGEAPDLAAMEAVLSR